MSENETIFIEQPNQKERTKPTKWWHWVLMYPSLVIFLLGDMPTVHQLYLSAKHDVPFSQAYDARQQEDYWARNLEDLDNKAFRSEELERDGVILDYRIFKSGDILIVSSQRGENLVYRWIGYEKLKPSLAPSLFSIKRAAADRFLEHFDPVMASKSIICQKRLGGGRILIRVRYGSRGCFDEVVDSGSGRVLSKTPVSCDRSCD